MKDKAYEPESCVVIVPVGHHIEPGCETALRELERRGHPVWRVYGYSAVDLARNQLASDALAAGFERLMWIDADVQFDPDDVARLHEHDEPFMSALYPKKGHRAFAANFCHPTDAANFGSIGGVLEMAGVGFGFVLTHRDVYRKIRDFHRLPECNRFSTNPLTPYFMPMVSGSDDDPYYLSEDLAFCERARQAGVAILADTRVRLWHIGTYAYSWEDAGSDVSRYGDYVFYLR